MKTRFIIALSCILVSLGNSFGKDAGKITTTPTITPLLFLQSTDDDDWGEDDDWFSDDNVGDRDVSEKETDIDSLPPTDQCAYPSRDYSARNADAL